MSEEQMPAAPGSPAPAAAPSQSAQPNQPAAQPPATTPAQPQATMKTAGESARAKMSASEAAPDAAPENQPASGQKPSGEAPAEGQPPKMMIGDQEVPAEEVRQLQQDIYLASITKAAISGDQKAIEELKKVAPEMFGVKQAEEPKTLPNPAHDPMIEESNKRLKAMEEKLAALEFEKQKEQTFKDLDALNTKYRMSEFFTGEEGKQIIGDIEYIAFRDQKKYGGLDKAYAHHANKYLNLAKRTVSSYVQTKAEQGRINTESGGGTPVPAPKAPAKTLKEAGKVAREKLQGPLQF